MRDVNLVLTTIVWQALILMSLPGMAHCADPNEEVVLYHYLPEIAEKLDCYFTIERVEYKRSMPSPLSDGREIKISHEPKTIDELVRMLADELKGVTVTRDPQRKNIVRLTEDRLSSVENYVVSEKVTLKFRGPLFKMVDELNALDPRIRRPFSHPINTPGPDEVTDTDVDVKDVPIRTLATDAVPLKGYFRVIWIATTRSLASKPYTELFYQGWEDPDVPASK